MRAGLMWSFLLAGMHSSISSHIVNDYLMDESRGLWGPNLAAFQERLGNEAVKERIENLYFAFLFVLRAVMKAGPYLESVSYSTGIPEEDARTSELIQKLVSALRPNGAPLLRCSSVVLRSWGEGKKICWYVTERHQKP